MKAHLTENMVVVCNSAKRGMPTGRQRILWLDRKNDIAVIIAMDDEKAMPVVDSAKKLDDLLSSAGLSEVADEYAYLATGDGFQKRHAKRIDANWDAIKGIVEDEPLCYDVRRRASQLTNAERETGRRRDVLLRDLRRYWQSGKQKNALVPQYHLSGAPSVRRIHDDMHKPGRSTVLEAFGNYGRGIPVTPAIAKIFEATIKKYLLKREPDTITYAHTKMCEAHFSVTRTLSSGRRKTDLLPQDQRPSERQFRYYIGKNYSMVELKKKQDGVEAYEQVMRPVLGNSSVDVMGPGRVYQIDATETDTHVVNSLYREHCIGRATHYFTTDAFSGALSGLHVGLDAPSTLAARLTLANAATPKGPFCAQYGVNIDEDEWPCRAFPRSVVADRGEMIAKKVDPLVDELNLEITNLPAFRPEWKPFVEGMFSQANNNVLHRLPGAIRKKLSEVRKVDPRLGAQIDINASIRILIEFALHYNKAHILDRHPFDRFEIQANVKPRPLDLWRWGVIHRSGALRVKSEDAIRLLLLERGEATVTGFGLRFKEADYDCSMAREQEWFQRARTKGSFKVKICFDRRNLEYIYLLPEDRRPLIACPLLRRDTQMAGVSLEEIEDYGQMLQYRNAVMKEEEKSSVVNLAARVEEVVEEQIKLTSDRKKIVGPMPKSSAKKEMREYRNEEQSRRNATVHDPIQKGLPKSTPVNGQPATLVKSVTEPVSLAKVREKKGLDLLRANRQKNQADEDGQ